MRIENGKWVNDHGDQLSVLEAKEIVSLGQRVSSVFGQDVTHERIEIINALSSNDKKRESIIGQIFRNDDLLDKLCGL